MKYFWLLVVCGCGGLPVPDQLPGAPWESVYQLNREDGARCSAVGLAGGYFATAGHCSDASSIEGVGPVSPAQPVPGRDIALGRAGLSRRAVPGANLPVPGTSVFLVGYGCKPLVRPGFWMAGPALDGSYQVAGKVCPGDSGGGVFTLDGRLVAIMTGYSPGLGHVVPIGELAPLWAGPLAHHVVPVAHKTQGAKVFDMSLDHATAH